ncbi:hypothetical protein PRIO_6462 [Paenibacillus riograndensis SBR5]|uniref:Uncharacterized protein n=1 Tax=Paenibacillus riograndensis SBR5 TaxID=1073571 RepID=A0A0E4HE63_9BACL|nr:hypothetical protein PRIO_6462 [Paenibacillus riograndensis SBR5]
MGRGYRGYRGYGATGLPGYRVTGLRGYGVTGLRGYGVTGSPGYRATGLPGYRATGLPGYRGYGATGLPGYRATGYRVTGLPGHVCTKLTPPAFSSFASVPHSPPRLMRHDSTSGSNSEKPDAEFRIRRFLQSVSEARRVKIPSGAPQTTAALGGWFIPPGAPALISYSF